MRQALLLLALAGTGAAQEPPPSWLERVSQEAAAFRRQAPEVAGREIMVQKSLAPSPRTLRRRVSEGEAVRYQVRRLSSEYALGSLPGEPNHLREFRDVVEVDGKPVRTRSEARRRLYAGIQGAGERMTQRMLEDLRAYGLELAVTGLGQAITLFVPERLQEFFFRRKGSAYLGAEPAEILEFERMQGKAELTLFEDRRVERIPLRGRLWLRRSDYLPLRIDFLAARTFDGLPIVEETRVEYTTTPYGFLLPASARHSRIVDGSLVVETVCTYEDFRRFSVDSSIQFEPVDEEQ